jgi:hypothetical protein
MSGGFYGMSASLLKEVMASPRTHINNHYGHEDVTTGKWINSTRPEIRNQLQAIKMTRKFNVHSKRTLFDHKNPRQVFLESYRGVLKTMNCANP